MIQSAVRENTILAITPSLESHLDSSILPQGRIPHTPSSMNASNEMFDYASRQSIRQASKDGSRILDNNNSNNNNADEVRSTMSTNDGNMSEMNDNVSVGGHSTATSTIASGGMSRSSSRASSRGDSANPNKLRSYGTKNLLSIRIKGEIIAAGTFQALQTPVIDTNTHNAIMFNSKWLDSVATTSVVPSNLPYITNNTVVKQSSNVVAYKLHPNGMIATLEDDIREPPVNINGAPVNPVTDLKLRVLTETVLSKVFQDILSIPSLQKYSRLVARESYMANNNGGLKLTSSDVQGKPESTIYYTVIASSSTTSGSSSSTSKEMKPTSVTNNNNSIDPSDVTLSCQDIFSDTISKAILDILNEVTSISAV